MPSIVYKCPNCNSGLLYKPDKKVFACEYCLSDFTEEDLKKLVPPEPEGAPKPATPGEAETDGKTKNFEDEARLYQCPTCGGEIVGDESTAAALCVYCHNPVILAGRLSGAFKPDLVVPFAFDKAAVKKSFLDWAARRWFIDGGFVDEATLANLRGVYYPFWVVDGEAEGNLAGEAENVRSWTQGDVEYTETKSYNVAREGRIDFKNLTLKALDKNEARMVEGVYPYDDAGLKDFSMPYLSGFTAEKRNLEAADLSGAAETLVAAAGKNLLRETLSEYDRFSEESFALKVGESKWRYALMPVWLMTYKYRGVNCFFAMNGQTGKVAGRAPVSHKKVGVFFGALSAVAAGLAYVGLGVLL